MEKQLQLYKFVDGVNDTPFPSATNQAVLYDFKYDAKRMGNAPTITGTIMHPQCLDDLWGTNLVYVVYNGERHFLKQTPTSSFSNKDTRYKHDVTFVSERIILNDVYFYDVVQGDASVDKPVSNTSTFTFFGDIKEFAQRLNYSLQYAKLQTIKDGVVDGYSVVVDDGISSDAKMLSFQDQFFANALQESYNTYEIPYYFVGKVIHIGFTNNAITHTFKYGIDNALLTIQKNNANYKIVNRVTGTGSADNIPYYYPNTDEKGVSKALLNGDDGKVTITNAKLYKKVKLSDIFTFTTQDKHNKVLTNGGEYTFESELTETSANIWEMYGIVYPFTIELVSDTFFEFGYSGDDLEFIDIQIYRGDDELLTRTNKEGSFSRFYPEGDYQLRVNIGIHSEEELNKSYAETIIKNININVYQVVSSYSGWYLNTPTKVVSLGDYGLTMSNAPTNGDKITFERVSYIMPQPNLMPPIYRESNGDERFYNALNDTYISPQTNDYYEFSNPYIDGKPKEHIVSFEDIKPSIVGMTNASGLRIDMFSQFAYDTNDNDEFDDEGNYLHPYFFAKLRKFDGNYGFNLFDHAIEEGEMVISMTSGACGACEFIIGVSEDTQENVVQVDENGNLLRDSNGNVLFGSPQPRQNDTQNYEVWIALKKDIDTFGVIMPNASNNYKPSANDTFVILHIDLPQSYILAAENRLKEEIVKYMAMNNSEKFTFSITFSRIFFAQNPTILAQLNENARLQIEYNGKTYELYVSSYSYNMSHDKALPEIKVELSDTLTISQNALQNAINSVKTDIMSSVGSIDFLRIGLKYFLRKDVDDRAKGKIASDVGVEVGKFVSGASGAIVYVDKSTGQTVAELDKLYVRMKAYFEQLEIINVGSVSGKQIISPAGSIRCSSVVDSITNEDGTITTWDYYRCYFLNEQDGEKIENRFAIGDQAYCQLFNAQSGTTNNISNKYYWRLVVGVGENYIDLSKSDCDSDSDVPESGDVICHRGNRNDVDRQNLIEFSSVGTYSPNITLYQGINSYSLVDKDIVSFGVDKTTNKAFMNVYGNMYVGDRDGNSYMKYTQEDGLELKGKLAVGTTLSDGTDIKDAIDSVSGYEYLKQALGESTTIEGGLVQTSLLMLGYTEDEVFHIMSGTNGLYDATKKGGGIAAWYGGEMKDAEDGTGAKSVIRFDGSGYFAGGNFKWDVDGAGSVAGGDFYWDKNGKIYLKSGVVIGGNEDETLGSILTALSDALYKSEGGTIEKDLYVKGELSMGTLVLPTSDGNVSSYSLSIGNLGAGATTPDADGGGSGTYVSFTPINSDYGTLVVGEDEHNVSINGHTHSQYLTEHQDISHLATKTELTNGLAAKQDKLGYTAFNSADFTKANIKTTLGISDWALSSAKPTYTASDVGALSINGGTIKGAIIPSANITYNLGSSSYAWNIIYTRYIDTYTGFDLRLNAAGTQRMQIVASTGNVLIGTTSDDTKHLLQVNGNISAKGIKLPSAAPSSPDSNGYYLYVGSIGAGSDTPSGDSGSSIGSVTIKFSGSDTSYTTNESGIVALPAYPTATSLGLRSLAYKDSLIASDIPDLKATYMQINDGGIPMSTTTNLNRVGYGYTGGGWKYSGPAIAFGSTNGYSAVIQQKAGDYALVVSYKNAGTLNGSWKTIAFTDSNVASASKLNDNTAYTAWGQTFFENGVPKSIENLSILLYKNPSGATAKWARALLAKDSSGTNVGGIGFYGAGDSLDYTYIGADYSSPLVKITSGGRILIGTTTDSDFKLQLAGYLGMSYSSASTMYNTMYVSGADNLIIGNGFANAGKDVYLSGNNLYMRYGTSKTNGIVLYSSGNVSIGGTEDTGYKFSIQSGSASKDMIVSNGGNFINRTNTTSGWARAFSLSNINATNNSVSYGALGTGTEVAYAYIGMSGNGYSTAQFKVIPDGKIGIGLPTSEEKPSYTIDAYSASQGDMLRLRSNVSYACAIYKASSGAQWSAGCNTNNAFYWYNNSAAAVVASISKEGDFTTIGDVFIGSGATNGRVQLHDIVFRETEASYTPTYWTGMYQWKDKLYIVRGNTTSGSIIQDGGAIFSFDLLTKSFNTGGVTSSGDITLKDTTGTASTSNKLIFARRTTTDDYWDYGIYAQTTKGLTIFQSSEGVNTDIAWIDGNGNFTAKGLQLPTSAPSNPVSGGYYLYVGTLGTGATIS